MTKGYQSKVVLARGKTVYLGIDMHKENWHVTVFAEGEEIFNGRIPGQYEALRKLLDRFEGCEVKATYEAGPFGFWLHDKLTEEGIETIVVPPSLIPIESGNKVKTDKRDSRKLASLLEKDYLKRVYVLSQEDRADRELVRTRRQIVEHRSDVAKQIKSKLLFYGIKSPFSGQQRWTKAYIQWLRGLRFSYKGLKVAFDSLIELYESLSRQILAISREIVKLSRDEKYAGRLALLKSIPGVGILSAMGILVELQDVERFRTAEELASYIGLTPSEYSTGPHVRQGRITRCGNKRVRSYLVESSWVLISKDPWMWAKYERIKNRRGAKRAIIAIARTLIIKMRRILLNNESYKMAMVA